MAEEKTEQLELMKCFNIVWVADFRGTAMTAFCTVCSTENPLAVTKDIHQCYKCLNTGSVEYDKELMKHHPNLSDNEIAYNTERYIKNWERNDYGRR